MKNTEFHLQAKKKFPLVTFQSVTIQMKATGQYSTAVLFIVLSMMVVAFCFLNSESLWEILKPHIRLLQCILYKVALTFESVGEIISHKNSN